MTLYTDAPEGDELATKDDEIVREAAQRFRTGKDWSGESDEHCREDIKFANGDARNRWQWPANVYEVRDKKKMPCLTINNTRTHNDMIINNMSKNPYAVEIRPTGGEGSYKAAEVYQKLVRRTQNISSFGAVSRTVAEHQVDGGVGYFLLETRHVSERSFDQDVYIEAARDPTGIVLDPYAKHIAGRDSDWGFTFEVMPRDEFGRKYPKFKDKVGNGPILTEYVSWITEKEVWIVKYYRKAEKKDLLVGWTDADGRSFEKLRSEIVKESGRELYDALIEDIKEGKIDGQTRSVRNPDVEWYLIGGDQIIERGKWAGKFIPIARVVGREVVVDRKLDRKGHTRPLIDAQRMLNYGSSAAVQAVALGVKSQWIAPARAIEGAEQWKDANVETYSVLTFNDYDEEAPEGMSQIAKPERIPPVDVPQAHMAVAAASERQMMMISGQFEAQMGENDTQSAASGTAIGERKAQGDVATYHFPQHMADALRYLGEQLVDLYPKIYDTKRVLTLTGDAGEQYFIHIDPQQPEDVVEMKKEHDDDKAVRLAFNPLLGEYEIVSDPGPDFATQRQQAWEAYSKILQQNMQLAGIIGDLIFKYGDFPGADDIADRLMREIKATKPYLFDPSKEPAIAQAQEQLQRLTALNADLTQKLANKELQLRGRDERRDIEASNAESKRLEVIVRALEKLGLPPGEKARMEHELGLRVHDTALDVIAHANKATIDAQYADTGEDDESGGGAGAPASPAGGGSGSGAPALPQPPMPGARQSPRDGKWYVQHPQTKQYYRVDKKAA